MGKTITKETIAKKLDKVKYTEVSLKEVKTLAEDNGIVIVYGHSDDCIEFDGAIYDEGYVSDGDVVKFDRRGIIPEWDDIEKDELQEVREYLERIDGETPSEIKVKWLKSEFDWSYETAIPHATFDVIEEDGNKFCKGIVFELKDVCGF